MGKKPPPPKPEELIEKLDEKVNNHHNFQLLYSRCERVQFKTGLTED